MPLILPFYSQFYLYEIRAQLAVLAIFGIILEVSCAAEEQKDHLCIKETVFLILLRTKSQKK